jgi:hypothetical protein
MIKTTNNRKKLTPASITAQKAWGKFPISLKKELSRALPDADRDNVPNGFDCKPKNKRRQESFLPEDANYLKNCKSVRLGSKLGSGSTGDVFTVDGTDNLVVKVATGLADKNSDANWVDASRKEIFKEWNKCDTYSADRQPLFTPTKAVKIYGYGTPSKPIYGLVRPKVTPLWRVANITESTIETIRQKLIKLSNDGYAFHDGIQLGLDRAKRPLVFDMGDVNIANSVREAFVINNREWRILLSSDLNKNVVEYRDLYGNFIV